MRGFRASSRSSRPSSSRSDPGHDDCPSSWPGSGRHGVDGEWGTFRPLVAGDVVVAGSEGRLVALRVNDGGLVWLHAVPGLPRGLGRSGDALYVGTLAGRVLALHWPEPGIAPSAP